MILAAIKRFLSDCRDLWTLLTKGAPAEDPIITIRILVEMAKTPDRKVDWFTWECEQYAKSPCFWFDHWRYEGTRFAYPDPTEEQRQAVFEASVARMRERFGTNTQRLLKQAEEAIAKEPALARELLHSPAPAEYAISLFGIDPYRVN